MRRTSPFVPLRLVAALNAAGCGDDVDVSELTTGKVVEDTATYEGIDYVIHLRQLAQGLNAAFKFALLIIHDDRVTMSKSDVRVAELHRGR